MSRQVGYRWLVDAPSRIYVNRIDNFVQRLSHLIGPSILRLILTSRSKEETPVRSEGQSAEERLQGIVGIDVSILHP